MLGNFLKIDYIVVCFKKNFKFCLFFMGNDGLSGKQVGSQASRRVTRRVPWIQPVCISINAVPALKRWSQIRICTLNPLPKCYIKIMISFSVFISKVRHFWKTKLKLLNTFMKIIHLLLRSRANASLSIMFSKPLSKVCLVELIPRNYYKTSNKCSQYKIRLRLKGYIAENVNCVNLYL